jgi:hypothetical protein
VAIIAMSQLTKDGSRFIRMDELMADLVPAAYEVNFLWISLTLAEYRIRDKHE